MIIGLFKKRNKNISLIFRHWNYNMATVVYILRILEILRKYVKCKIACNADGQIVFLLLKKMFYPSQNPYFLIEFPQKYFPVSTCNYISLLFIRHLQPFVSPHHEKALEVIYFQ